VTGWPPYRAELPDWQNEKILQSVMAERFRPGDVFLQRIEAVRDWFERAGLVEVELKRGYNGINAKENRLG
jgi:hypothetical protein